MISDETSILKNRISSSKTSGNLNISHLNLTTLPLDFSLPSDTKWWEIVDLKKLIAADNLLTSIPLEILDFNHLVVFDVHNNQIQYIPDFNGLEELRVLNLSNNRLKKLDLRSGLVELYCKENMVADVALNLVDLKILDLSHNALAQIDLKQLQNLVTLNLAHNALKEVDLSRLTNLTDLNLSNNGIVHLDDIVSPNLKLLDLRNNKLTNFSLNTPKLLELYCGFNKLTIFQPKTLHAPNLITLDLRDNNLSMIPEDVLRMKCLERLDITNNSVKSMQPEIGLLPVLKVVYFSGNPLRGYPLDSFAKLKEYLVKRVKVPNDSDGEEVVNGGSGVVQDRKVVRVNVGLKSFRAEEYPNAQDIDFSGNFISALPHDFHTLVHLKSLKLSKNRLSCFTFSFPQLTFLDLSLNLLTQFPNLDLPNLYELNLNGNRLTLIPMCASVNTLLLSDNKIECIDMDVLEACVNLRHLDLSNNDIRMVPPRLGLLELKHLGLMGNVFKVPRMDVLQRGTGAILEYLKNRVVQ